MTLIEVLIASVILFIAIGTVSGVHKVLNYYQRINMLDYALLLNQSSFFDYLSYSLEQNTLSGSYQIGGYLLVWQANLVSAAPVIKSFDPELGNETGFKNTGNVFLYSVAYYFEQYPDKKFEVTQLVVKK